MECTKQHFVEVYAVRLAVSPCFKAVILSVVEAVRARVISNIARKPKSYCYRDSASLAEGLCNRSFYSLATARL